MSAFVGVTEGIGDQLTRAEGDLTAIYFADGQVGCGQQGRWFAIEIVLWRWVRPVSAVIADEDRVGDGIDASG